ncbi:MAG: oxidoreductase, partial [Candidatus Heimdallarchaeota archaeon]
KKLVDNYAKACLRIKKAGFDGVEIHAGHGYLLNQFFSPLFNNRTDEYGGSLENRVRLAVEVLQATRDKCGEDFIIGFRLNCRDYIEGGLEVEDMAKIAVILENKGADLLNITAGIFDSPYYPVVPFMNQPRGVYADHTAVIKKAVKKIPICAVGRINTPEIAEEILQNDKADLVAMGRALIADPMFPNKVKNGMRMTMKICPACNTCLNQILIEEQLACAINPNLFKTEQEIQPADKKMKVLIIGAGPAGLVAGFVSKTRGHEVVVIEKDDKIGGNLNIGSKAPMKHELTEVINNLKGGIKGINLDVRLKTPYNSSIVNEFKPDVAIIATGSVPDIPEIKGLNKKNIFLFDEVFNGKIPDGKSIAILGGGMIGIELANLLSSKGKMITLIDENAVLGADLFSLVGSEIVQRTYDDEAVKVFTSTEVNEVKDHLLLCTQNESPIEIPYDDLIVATEPKPFCDFESEIKELVPKVFKIGDCKKRNVRKLVNATAEGYQIGITLDTAEPEPSITDIQVGEGLRGLVIAKIKSGTFGIEDIPEYMEVMRDICNENPRIQSKSKKSVLAFQFKIVPGPSFWIKINNGKFTIGDGTLEHNDVIIEMNKNIAAGVFTGDVNAAAAYMSKQIKFIGPLRHGMKFQQWTNTVMKELDIE